MARSFIFEDQVLDSDFVSEDEHTHEVLHYFRDLADVPTYSGTGGDLLLISSPNEDGLIYTTASGAFAASGARLIDLIDTPTAYDTGSVLISTESGFEFTTISGVSSSASMLLELEDTPSVYEDGKALVSTTSGTVWADIDTYPRYYIEIDVYIIVNRFGQYNIHESVLEVAGTLELNEGGMIILHS